MALPQLLKDLAQTCKSKPIESGRCSYEESGPVHVVLARDDISMGILVSNAQVYGLSFLIQKISPTVAISGGFYSSITSLRCKLLGEIVRDGKLVQKGEPGSTYAYMVYTGSGVYGFGQGITPRTYKGKIVKEGLHPSICCLL